MTQQTPGEGQRINDRIQIPHDNTNKNLREKNLTKKLHAMIKKTKGWKNTLHNKIQTMHFPF